MSSKQSYERYDDDLDKSDSLICGFGPRGGHAESNDDTAAGASSADIDANDTANKLNANLICGFDRGDGGSFGSSGQSTGSEMLAVRKEEGANAKVSNTNTASQEPVHQQLGDGDQPQSSPLLEATNVTGATSDDNMKTKMERDEDSTDYQVLKVEHMPLTVPTKTDSTPTDPSRVLPRDSSNRSIGSEGGLSMASEDAIVLISNFLDNSDDESNDAKNLAEEEIIGRVYKTKRADKYDSIPIELEINTSLMTGPPPIKRQDRRSAGDIGGTTLDRSIDKNPRRSSDGVLASVMAAKMDGEKQKQQSSTLVVEQNILHSETDVGRPPSKPPQSAEQITNLPEKDSDSHLASVPTYSGQHTPLNDNAAHEENSSSMPQNIQTNSYAQRLEPFQSRRRSSILELALDVIAEDETDESTAANSVLKSSMSSKNSSKQASQSAAVGFEEVIDESFSIPTSEPLGEHAKSMAVSFGMVDNAQERPPRRRMREY